MIKNGAIKILKCRWLNKEIKRKVRLMGIALEKKLQTQRKIKGVDKSWDVLDLISE